MSEYSQVQSAFSETELSILKQSAPSSSSEEKYKRNLHCLIYLILKVISIFGLRFLQMRLLGNGERILFENALVHAAIFLVFVLIQMLFLVINPRLSRFWVFSFNLLNSLVELIIIMNIRFNFMFIISIGGLLLSFLLQLYMMTQHASFPLVPNVIIVILSFALSFFVFAAVQSEFFDYRNFQIERLFLLIGSLSYAIWVVSRLLEYTSDQLTIGTFAFSLIEDAFNFVIRTVGILREEFFTPEEDQVTNDDSEYQEAY